MITPGIVLAYHGCDREVGERILSGGSDVESSTNDYDWLGSGAYFWEGDSRRAVEWARFLKSRPAGSRGRIREPFAIGAVLLPGFCLDLTDAESLRHLSEAHSLFATFTAHARLRLPENLPGGRDDHDLVKRHLDCAVFNFLHEHRAGVGEPPFDTIRCPFFEGRPVFTGSKIAARTHIQWCIRDPRKCVVGYFRVRA